MKLLRTPDERFENLPDYPFEPNYVQVGEKGLSIRIRKEGIKFACVIITH